MALSYNLPFDPADAVGIVREASQLALRLRGTVTPDIKPDNTLVTAADRQVEALLQEKLGKLAPGFSFLGEETGLTGAADVPCWAIDPIDGTTNFVRGLPLWCVSVGLVYRGEVIFGVLATPPQNEVMWATQGGGAWLQTGALSPETHLPKPMRLRAFDAEFLLQEDLIACNTTAENVVDTSGVPCRLRNTGSLAYHLALMARGTLVCAMSHQHKIYDVAAGICICQEAGCVVRYLDGEPWRADVEAPRETMPLLVAPPQIMNNLLQYLKLS
jgi:fructose-1,6-bisphosphatase/inositol monophosphatase family enzyme